MHNRNHRVLGVLVTAFVPMLAATGFGQTPCLPQAYPEELTPPGLTTGAKFGSSASVYGARAVVGASQWKAGKGGCFVYEFANGTVSPGTLVEAFDSKVGDAFGSAVSLHGEMMLVGAPGDDTLGFDAGAAYIFQRAMIQGAPFWLQTAKIFAPDAKPGDHFGSAVGLSGLTAVIGAPDKTIALSHQGHAYAFEYLFPMQKWVGTPLSASLVQANENYGAAVAIDGDMVLVGAPNFDSEAQVTNVGRVFGFHRDPGGSTWSKWAYYPGFDTPNRRFGASVALQGSAAAIGAPGWVNPNNFASGGAYLYPIVNGSFGVGTVMTSIAGLLGQDDQVGTSVAITGLRAYLASPTRVAELISNGLTWNYSIELHAPFYDLEPGTPKQLGPVVAASPFFTVVGRPTGLAGDNGHAFAFYNCGGQSSVVGAGTAGTLGEPRLRVDGPLGTSFTHQLRLVNGLPNSLALLAVHAGSPNPLPFHTGLLQAFPIQLLLNLPIDAAGAFTIPSTLPSGFANQTFVLQCLIPDPLGPGGVSLSNGALLKTGY